MKLNTDRTAFGRHETFPLRYGWLTKGYQAVKKNPKIFDSDDATVALGVGKNMVASIKYWLRATGFMDLQSTKLTPIAHYIFDEVTGVDPYLEDEATLWLVHWHLATNAESATTWFWFFNCFHKPQFIGQELQTALNDFVKAEVRQKAAAATLKNDASVLTRMYCKSLGNGRTPLEEALDSPLSLLGLLTQSPGGRSYHSRASTRNDLPIGIFGYAVIQLLTSRAKTTLPIEELMYSREQCAAPGAVFRLTEADLIGKLEQLVEAVPNTLQINETAGIHQVLMQNELDPIVFLKHHYEHSDIKEVAA